ncbi:outer membrane protein assembly factor BamB family protein [Streptomyces sp. NBC_01236]|uniref:outer membrane protein assembly factor BamB family protein n=1 Tax=Streptomyces sp. NBC_01236 TaxID=2903789 RepID=UPI002E10DDB3|nr:PQQ-like beta-propeller repeat protein [Streptomyces sp. NBC_01236]
MDEDRVPEPAWDGTSARPWWRRGSASAPRLWRIGREKGDPGAPLGAWAVAGTLALARFDRVQAYGLTTGEPLWTWRPPGDEVIAHVSQDAPDGVGVVLHIPRHDGGDSHAEHVRLTGLDLGTGKVVRSRRQRADGLGSVGGHAREVALGGGRIATVRTPAPAADTEPTIRVLDARTGTLQWERPLPGNWSDVSVLAARPVVVSAAGREEGAPHRLHVVSEDAEQTIELATSHEGFGPHTAVVGDTLAVELVPPHYDDQEDEGSELRVFSGATGGFLWRWHSTYGRTVFPLAHRGCLVVLNGYGDRATVLDPADGRVVAERALPGYSHRALLVASGDCLAVICTAARPNHRVRVFRWR